MVKGSLSASRPAFTDQFAPPGLQVLLPANSDPAKIINPHVFGSNACWDQTLSMINIGVSPIPYAELPVEARALLFIFALGAAAHYMGQPPN